MIQVPDDEKFAKIKQLAEEIYYSPDACEPDKVYELERLTSPYQYMDFERTCMRRHFEDYLSFKRQSKKDQAWSSVRDHAHKLVGLASMARYPGNKPGMAE